jgi:MFS family permease
VSALSFSVNLAAPYFAVLMLQDLKFNYLTYTTVSLTATLTINFLCARWGSHADVVGNHKILRLTSRIICIIPLLWLVDQSPWFLIFAQIISGFAWAGFNLCASNYIFDAITPSKRPRCIAYFNVLNGLALCAGSLLGGYLVTHLPPIHGSPIFTLFIVSTVCRIFAATTIHWVKEVRPVEPIKSNDLFFSMVGVKPILGVERKTVRY